MKVNLLFDNPSGVLSGYLNIDPTAKPDDPTRTACNLHELGEYIERGEATHIRAFHVLDLYEWGTEPPGRPNRGSVLGHWLSLLAHQGELTLVGTDLSELIRLYDIGKVSLLEFSRAVYQWRSATGLVEEIRNLEGMGLEIISAETINATYALKVRRK